MRFIVCFLALLWVWGFPVLANQPKGNQLSKYFQIQDVSVEEVATEVSDLQIGSIISKDHMTFAVDEVASDCLQPDANSLMYLDKIESIIRIGKALWEIVKENKPEANVHCSMAHALPKGYTSWHQLYGWQRPVVKTFRIQYRNFFKITVVDFTFKMIFVHGGTDGTGKYLARMSFIPAHLSVKPGFKFDAIGKVPAVYNVGKNNQELVAGADMQLFWKLTSIFANEQRTISFHVDANGNVEKL